MNNHSKISVRTLTAMALLIAMSIVFSRVLSISTGFVRFNLGSLPVLLAGILFWTVGGLRRGHGGRHHRRRAGGLCHQSAHHAGRGLHRPCRGAWAGRSFRICAPATGCGAACLQPTSSAPWSSIRWRSTSSTAMRGRCWWPASRMRWCSPQ